jgi:hypothetical protein
MSKPLGYYTDLTPGDGSFLDVLQNEYGSRLEQMNLNTKWLIISFISLSRNPRVTKEDLESMQMNLVPQYQEYVIEGIKQLPEQTQNGLIVALMNQIINGVFLP